MGKALFYRCIQTLYMKILAFRRKARIIFHYHGLSLIYNTRNVKINVFFPDFMKKPWKIFDSLEGFHDPTRSKGS